MGGTLVNCRSTTALIAPLFAARPACYRLSMEFGLIGQPGASPRQQPVLMMIQFFTPDPKRDRGRGDSSCAHNQLIDAGYNRWVQGELDAFVRDAAYVGRGPVP